MGPCDTCGAPGSWGAPHPKKKTTVWACSAHRAALPKRDDRNYAATEAHDRECAMREAARILVQKIGRERVAEIGREAFEAAFLHGLDAYFAMRSHQLDP